MKSSLRRAVEHVERATYGVQGCDANEHDVSSRQGMPTNSGGAATRTGGGMRARGEASARPKRIGGARNPASNHVICVRLMHEASELTQICAEVVVLIVTPEHWVPMLRGLEGKHRDVLAA